MRTHYTHRLTQRILGVWQEVGRIVTEWLPKLGLYYRDPRVWDTRRPVHPSGRPASGRWPVAQIAIISSITCSIDSRLWALIVEQIWSRVLNIQQNFAKLGKASRKPTYHSYISPRHVHSTHTRSHMPHKWSEQGEISWPLCILAWGICFIFSPLGKKKNKNTLSSL